MYNQAQLLFERVCPLCKILATPLHDCDRLVEWESSLLSSKKSLFYLSSTATAAPSVSVHIPHAPVLEFSEIGRIVAKFRRFV